VISRLLRFGMVGVVGYLVDTGTLVLLVQYGSMTPLLARCCSFVVAASVTFVLNQRFTFRTGELSAQRWSLYLITTAAGAAINIGVYHAWLTFTDIGVANLVIGTAIGSIVAMGVNYAVSSTLVFRPTAGPAPSDSPLRHN
jgi:putative flippase GtrA